MTELVWKGKYDNGKKTAPVRTALPFQTIETINESAAARGLENGWRNRLIWGDNKYVLPSLLPELAGKVSLIYIDPPFDTGADLSFTATIPAHPDTEDGETTSFVKQPAMIEQTAYRDSWGRGLDLYLQWFYETTVHLRDLLAEEGSIYVHLDWHVLHYCKMVLDEVFGYENFRNEIVWQRTTNTGSSKGIANKLSNDTDSILYYGKSASPIFNKQFRPYSEEYLARFKYEDERGKYRWQYMSTYSQEKLKELEAKGMTRWSKGSNNPEYKQYLSDLKGIPLSNLWDDIFHVNPMANEKVTYATQKPEALLERIIKTSSHEGHLVLDCFCGSGTTAVAAEKLNRGWIACDLGRFAIHTTRKRLLGIPHVKPFVVQNLGKHERQAWQAVEFSSQKQAEDQRERELRYRKFILELYNADLASGYTSLHGLKSGRMVHVGGVDAPVTLGDVKTMAADIRHAMGKAKSSPQEAGIDVLGWEFAFELNEVAQQIAAETGVDIRFKKIPREVMEKRAVKQGDIHFFELAALSVEVETQRKANGAVAKLKLKDFIPPRDDAPPDVLEAITHWSQWIDFWAVDWDFQGDTFHHEWRTFRSRRGGDFALEASHIYEKPGAYTIVVKVIDILGNDTTKTVQFES